MSGADDLIDASKLAQALEARGRDRSTKPAELNKLLSDAVDLANRILNTIAPDGSTSVADLNAALTALAMVTGRILVSTAHGEADSVSDGITDFLGALLANSNEFIVEELWRRALN